MAWYSRLTVGISVAAVVAMISACDDSGPTEPTLSVDSSFISDPDQGSGVVATAGHAFLGASEVVYVAIPPGRHANAVHAVIRHKASGLEMGAAVVDGGVDPVSVLAAEGDEIELLLLDGAGGTVATLNETVPRSRRPRVVRTIPPRRKTDVPRNARLTIIFTEPMDGGTVNGQTVRLMQGNTAVAGTVQFLNETLDATRVSVEFVPDQPLTTLTEYQLVVTTGIRDLDGESLATTETVQFTTGQSLTGPPASIRLSPDSLLTMTAGTTYQVTASVRDAAGNPLNDRQVSWSSTNEAVLTVSSTGRLTALGDGFAQIFARVDDVLRVLTVSIRPNASASLTISPPGATIAQGDTILLVPAARDAADRVINNFTTTWVSNAPNSASVQGIYSQTHRTTVGRVIGLSQGNVTIAAEVGAARATAEITVGPPRSVASITVTPSSTTLIVQGSAQLTATLRDANDRVLTGRAVAWATDNTSIATVNSEGLVTGVGIGSARVIATSEGVSNGGTITVGTLSFTSVTSGKGYTSESAHTCALANDSAAYCWGVNRSGQTGVGSYEWALTTPTGVTGGLAFATLSAGDVHTCGLTTEGRIYCWGNADYGQVPLDDSSQDLCNDYEGNAWCSRVPVAVGGAQRFATLSSGGWHACALTASGAASCWGYNYHGQLGNGSTLWNWTTTPLAVSGGLTFSSLSAGEEHTCGLTTSGIAYCWGYGEYGQLGDGKQENRTVPTAVNAGELRFAAQISGGYHTCALTAAGAAYCWGGNENGALGNGASASSSSPVPVSGGLTFATISAGVGYTCGVTTSGAAYCWGQNWDGRLGDGSTTARSTPVAVSGGFSFGALSAGHSHTCGLTTASVLYCWGNNSEGQLGTASRINSTVPVKVVGQP